MYLALFLYCVAWVGSQNPIQVPSAFTASFLSLDPERFRSFTVYNDTNIGERTDYYHYEGPVHCSQFGFNVVNSTRKMTVNLYYRFNGTMFITPLCVKPTYDDYFPFVTFNPVNYVGIGSVFGQPTLTYTDSYNGTWFEVVNSTVFTPKTVTQIGKTPQLVTLFSNTAPPASTWTLPSTCYSFSPMSTKNPPMPTAYSYDLYYPADGSKETFYANGDSYREDFGGLMPETHIYIKNTGYRISHWPSVSPTPCVLTKVYPPKVNSYYYMDTVPLSSSPIQKLDLYGSMDEQQIYAFDSTTQVFKFIYDLDIPFRFDTIVENWNPTPPPASLFDPPSVCYDTFMSPASETPDPQAPVFPEAFTMVYTDGDKKGTVYYNGSNMWRWDSEGGGSIKIQNMIYSYQNVDNEGISPSPCSMDSIVFHFQPFGIPNTPFVTNLGTATVDGKAARVWATAKTNFPDLTLQVIWYFDQNNNPLFLLTEVFSFQVLSLQVGPPPPSVFIPPSFCLTVGTI